MNPSPAFIPPVLHYVLLAISILGSMAAFQAVYRFFLPSAQGAVTPKAVAGESAFDRLEASASVLARLDLFFVHQFRLGARLEEIYMLLGRPVKPTPVHILHYQELAALLVPFFLYVLLESPAAALAAPIAFWLPLTYFQSKVRERQLQIQRGFPAFVDLAALTIESGLDYMSAFDRIVRSTTVRSELEIEVEKMLSEIQLGYSRREALRRLAMRTGLQDVRSFVGLIIQSDELGTSLVDLLRNFSQDMRFRRLNKAEKVAAQAATKMLVPIFLFIFPTVFVLMLAPMMVNLFKGGLGF
ncbi:MAG: type II secretion system F family protein [Elusimicrobia bacterium]|nr:type II secretion system F family protein [Elusimicrobiota bacterium]